MALPNLSFRYAQEGDEQHVLDLIIALAEYEHLREEVVATAEILHEWLFVQRKAEVIFIMLGEVDIGYMLFFHNFSTFLGRAGIYLEDLFILPEYRHRGYGKAALRHLAGVTVERGCGRLEWSCLDWNKPSIDFYKSLGAVTMEGWSTYRLTGDTLNSLAEK